MAEVVKCEKGHYYDKSMFVRCPHCEAGAGDFRNTTGYRNEVSRYAIEYLQEQRGRGRIPQDNPVKMPEPSVEMNPGKGSYPEGSWDKENDETVYDPRFLGPDSSEIFGKGFPDEGIKQNEPVSQDLNRKRGEGLWRGSDNRKDGETIRFSNNQNYMVTGWLVCVDGPSKGYSFNLYYGFNTIGYSRNNQIRLLEDTTMVLEDTTVAGKVHCSVVYEDRKNCFYLVPEEGRETYLNDQRLTEASELKNEDRIHIGKTQFVFIAFCGGERKWDRKLMRR